METLPGPMTSGFYEQLGVEAGATQQQLRAAYASSVARHQKRRRATSDAGGDTGPLDVGRGQLDEAWAVLSDPVRRRRYDAMVLWSAGERNSKQLWEQVSPVLVLPGVATAVRLVRALTRLTEVGDLVAVPGPRGEEPPTLIPADEDLTSPRVPQARLSAGTPVPMAQVVEIPSSPGLSTATPVSGLRFVDGSTSTPSLLALHAEMKRKGPSPDEVTHWVDQHGWGGTLMRTVRESRGISLQDLADTTRISIKYLEALEGDDFSSLPSTTFVRGYLREVARTLGLDEEALVAGTLRRMET